MARTKHWIWFSALPLSPGQKTRLLAHMSVEELFFAEKEELLAAGIGVKEAEKLADKSMERVRKTMSFCEDKGIRILTLQDADYPERLRNIPEPPAALYIWGKLPEIDELAAVAVVGTRKLTPYGLKMARLIGGDIAKAGGLVVSGLAEGADSAAMEAALEAGGSSIGVLGTAIDEVYPAKNRPLFERVKAVGALVSEYPPGMRTFPSDFKCRNRIIAGLTVGTVVVEAPARSGALDTAGHALEQGRDVFAVPGNADAAACAGNLKLIRAGAEIAVNGAEVMARYEGIYRPCDGRKEAKKVPTQLKKEIDKAEELLYIDLREKIENLPELQRRVAQAMTKPDMLAEDIIDQSGLSAREVSGALTMLQIAGLVRQGSGKRYSLDTTKGKQ